jgi:hypothetical protein
MCQWRRAAPCRSRQGDRISRQKFLPFSRLTILREKANILHIPLPAAPGLHLIGKHLVRIAGQAPLLRLYEIEAALIPIPTVTAPIHYARMEGRFTEAIKSDQSSCKRRLNSETPAGMKKAV